MQRLVRTVIYIFVGIFGLTAIVTLAGLTFTWYAGDSAASLPHLDTLLYSLLLEVVAVVILLAREGLKYLPKVVHNKTIEDTSKFMQKFVSNGTSITIVSNRLGWLIEDHAAKAAIANRARNGASIEVITSKNVGDVVRRPLEEAGVKFFQTLSPEPPEARFTLVNANRSGAERLAIATGTHPDHQITIFDANSGPQIIGMAKDIVRKSKETSRAAAME